MMRDNRLAIRIIIFTMIVFQFAAGKEHCHAMELGGTETDAEEAEKFAEYEMNIVLDLLDIKDWKTRSPAVDEWNMPSDEPLGRYSEEALAPYLDGGTEIKVEIGYYRGGFQPDKRRIVPVLNVQVYEDGVLTRIEDVICWGYGQRVEYHDVYKNVKPLGWNAQGQDTQHDPLIRQAPINRQPVTRTDWKLNGERVRQNGRKDMVLSASDITQVMETLLMMKDKRDKERLSELPLTERFYQQCMDAVPCITDVEDMRGFWIHHYGVGDGDKVLCQCILSPHEDRVFMEEYYTYQVEMQLENGQIDSMHIILLGHYILNGNSWYEVAADE